MIKILVDNEIIQQLLSVYNNPLSILDEDTLTNLNTLLEIDFDMEGSKELDGFLSKYKFKFVDI